MEDISVEEFLKSPKEDVVAEAGEELLLDPDSPGFDFDRHFHRVRVVRFEELQELEFIPEQLPEEEVLRAIAKDDEAALERARELISGSASDEKETVRLRRVYAEIRPSYNFSLAEVVSAATGVPATWRDLHVALIRKRVRAVVESRPRGALGLFMLKDLIILRDATVTLGATVMGMYGNALQIHKHGNLVVKGLGVKLRFVSAQGEIG
jgi:hypothetical protein